MTDDRPAVAGGDPVRVEWLAYGGQDVGEREAEAVVEALQSDYITRGPQVDTFEEAVADRLGVDHAVAVTSGTAALHLAGLAAFDPGDEVITTPLTFAATANAAVHADARPVFADIDPETRNLDPNAVRDQLTEDTAGLIPVHYAGHPCKVDELLEIAEKNSLTVIWDACHAIGSRWTGESIGAQPDAAVFSFHPVKTITTGEGGMVVTDDTGLAERVRSLRSFTLNRTPKGHEDEPWYQVVEGLGFNYNVTDIQAAIGLVQLERLDEFADRRKAIAARYDEAFSDLEGLRTPTVREDADPVWHLYAVEVDEAFGATRLEFVEAMHAENIGVQVHYVPLHWHPYYRETFDYERGDFPVTEQVYDGLVSLPLFPAMSDDDIEGVIRAVRRFHAFRP